MRLVTVESDPGRAHRPPPVLDRVLGSHFGLGRALRFFPSDPEDPRFYATMLVGSDLAQVLGPGTADPRAGGAGTTVEAACYSAVGEFVERYAGAAFVRDAETLVGSYRDLRRAGHEPVDPGHVPLFAPWQYGRRGFPFRPFGRDTTVAWVPGVSLVDGRTVWVPRQLALLTSERARGEAPIGYATSTGLAASTTLEDALLKGLYESVERDAVMVSWYSHAPPPPLDAAADPDVSSFLSERFPALRQGLVDVRLLDLTTDIPIPVVFALHIDHTGRPTHAHVGAACRLDPRAAAQKALVELGQGAVFLKFLVLNEPLVQGLDRFTDLEKNVRFYGEPANFGPLEYLLAGARPHSFSDLPNLSGPTPRADLATSVRLLGRAGLEPIGLDLTTQDVRDLGFRVARTFVPGLVPLSVPHRPYLGSPRIAAVPRRLGLARGRGRRTRPYLDAPHPFP